MSSTTLELNHSENVDRSILAFVVLPILNHEEKDRTLKCVKDNLMPPTIALTKVAKIGMKLTLTSYPGNLSKLALQITHLA